MFKSLGSIALIRSNMRHRNIFFGILIFLISCQNDNSNNKYHGYYHGLLPCKISVYQKDTLYKIDFNQINMVLKNKSIKPIYNDFEIFELYPFHLDIFNDSVSGELKGVIEFDINSYINLLADTVSDKMFRVGDYVYPEYTVENISKKRSSLNFQIVFEREDNPLVINAGISFNKNENLFFIDTNFIGRLHNSLNPVFDHLDSDKYYFQTIETKDEFYEKKLLYYHRQIEALEKELNAGSLDNFEMTRTLNSIKYMSQLINTYPE